MEQSVESNFFKKFKAIASLPILRPYFRFFFLEKRFLRKSSKPGHGGNLVLITSTLQVDFSKLNFNYGDIRTYFLHVLEDCWPKAFVTLIGFCPLSKKNPPPAPKWTISRWIEYYPRFFTLRFKFWSYLL